MLLGKLSFTMLDLRSMSNMVGVKSSTRCPPLPKKQRVFVRVLPSEPIQQNTGGGRVSVGSTRLRTIFFSFSLRFFLLSFVSEKGSWLTVRDPET